MTAILKTSSWYGGLSGSDSKGESEDLSGGVDFISPLIISLIVFGGENHNDLREFLWQLQ